MKRASTAALLCAAASALSAQPPPEPGCGVIHSEGIQDVYEPPRMRKPVAAGVPVTVAQGAVIASEALGIYPRAWRTDRALVLPRPHSFTYNPERPVEAIWTDTGERRCIIQGPFRGNLVCLLDLDGNGDYESADLFDARAALYRAPIRWQLRARVGLEEPVRLIPDSDTTIQILAERRIRVDAFDGDVATLVTEFAVSERGRDHPVRIAERSVLILGDGGHSEISGISFRIARSGAGWTLTPEPGRFPDWISYECGGSRVRFGRP